MEHEQKDIHFSIESLNCLHFVQFGVKLDFSPSPPNIF